MPLSLAQMEALIADGGANTASDIRSVINALYGWIPTEQKYMAGRLPGETAHASDDFFTAYSGYTEQTPTGTAVWAAGFGGLGVKFDDQSGNDIAATLKAIPGGPPLTIQTAWQIAGQSGANRAIGLCFTDGTSATSNVAGYGYMSGFGAATMAGTLTAGSATATAADPERVSLHQGLVHVRLVWKSSNTFAWAWSVDGSTWHDAGASDTSITITPTHMGLWVSTWSRTTPSTAVFRYLRVNEADLSV